MTSTVHPWRWEIVRPNDEVIHDKPDARRRDYIATIEVHRPEARARAVIDHDVLEAELAEPTVHQRVRLLLDQGGRNVAAKLIPRVPTQRWREPQPVVRTAIRGHNRQ